MRWILNSILGGILLYFQTFDGTKALQITYYSVALILSSIGLWKAIRFAEHNMPKRLLEFASRFEGRIVEKKLRALERISLVPMVPRSANYLDVNAEVDRAMAYLDRGDPENAASELERLAVRLEEKMKVADAQLSLTKLQTASVQLLFGSLARKVPQRADQSLIALKRTIELTPGDPEGHKEIGLLWKEANEYPTAREFFQSYRKASDQLSKEKRKDKDLLLVDAHQLTAECHRLESSPDLEKRELVGALQIADGITDQDLKPHIVRARLLEQLGDNARNRRSPQTDRIEEYYGKSAAEFRLAGLHREAERVLQKKQTKSAA